MLLGTDEHMCNCGGGVDVVEGEKLFILRDDERVSSMLALHNIAEFAEITFLGHREHLIKNV